MVIMMSCIRFFFVTLSTILIQSCGDKIDKPLENSSHSEVGSQNNDASSNQNAELGANDFFHKTYETDELGVLFGDSTARFTVESESALLNKYTVSGMAAQRTLVMEQKGVAYSGKQVILNGTNQWISINAGSGSHREIMKAAGYDEIRAEVQSAAGRSFTNLGGGR